MRPSKRQWVAGVQSTSNAMDLEPGVFRKKSAEAIAKSVLRSVKRSRRRKGTILSSGLRTTPIAGAGISRPLKRKRSKAQKINIANWPGRTNEQNYKSGGDVQQNRINERQTTMINRMKSGGYRLYSRKKNPKTGKRRNLGTFKSQAVAKNHERAVQFFKRH
jgi:hypothetical protein